jgi:hypothetical protein
MLTSFSKLPPSSVDSNDAAIEANWTPALPAECCYLIFDESSLLIDLFYSIFLCESVLK